MKTIKNVLFAVLILTAGMAAHAQKISSATLGDITARSIGPAVMGGRITCIEGVNANPKLVYVGAAGGGVWKTEDAGVSFKSVFDKYCQSIGDIAIDQRYPDTLWVGTGESNMRNTVSIGNGIYMTKDGGENWQLMGLQKTEHISKVIIHPENSAVVYVAAPGPLWSDGPDRGVYKTSDGGKTWEKIFYINESTGCADLIMDPQNPEVLIASMWEFRRKPYAFESGGPSSGLFRSTDGGKTWVPIRKGLPEGDLGRMAIAQAPSKPDRLAMICESKETKLYLSEDRGENWKEQASTFNVKARPFYFSTLQFDPLNADRLYRPAFNMSISDDGGYSFYDAPGGNGVHADHHALWINPANTSQMYLGTDGGVYMSVDKGNNWQFIRCLPVSQFYHVDVDNQQPYYRVFGGLQDNGSWMAPSQSPGGVENSDWVSLYGGDGFWVVPDPVNSDYVYAEYQGGNIARVNVRTNTSRSIKPYEEPGDEKLRWHWNTPLVMSPNKKGALYTGSQFLYRTANQGKSWTKLSPDLSTNDKKKQKQEDSGGLSADVTSAENHCIIYSIAESPLDSNVIFAGTDDGNFQVTLDGGKSWVNRAAAYAAAGIPEQTWVSSIHASTQDAKVVFATFDNHTYGDHQTYAAMSKDHGKTWSKFSSTEFSGFANKIVQDPVNASLLYLGTEMGLFMSFDSGQTWIRYKAEFPWMAMVRDMVVHPGGDLVIATHGRGIYIIDDLGPLRKFNAVDLGQEVLFLDSRKTYCTGARMGGNQTWNAGEYNGGNYTDDVVITYYLKDRLTTGDAKIIIRDEEGKVIRDIPAGKRKGLNRITWDMRTAPPKVPEGGTKLNFGGFMGPLVLPGKYSAELRVGNQVYTHDFEILQDPAADYTLEERNKQYEVSIKLFNQLEDLAKRMDEVISFQKQVDSLSALTTDAKLRKDLKTYRDSLENIRKEMVPTKHTSIFADEERLREKISDVYAQVLSYEGEPSNFVYKRLEGLKLEVDKLVFRHEKVNQIQLESLNKKLVKKGMKTIEKPGQEVKP
ncbi:MAG: glycosyl hydrolase [Saprospiraceae bacterium]|nr:glycosyl hydrolase [Saprospiraceae bacterium]